MGDAATPMPARRAAALVAASSAAFACAFPPVGLWPATVVAAALLALVVARSVPRGTRGGGLPWRVALAAAPVLWLKWLLLHAWLVQVTVAGTPALATYCTLHEILALWLLARCARAVPARVPWAVLVPLALGAGEAFRALVLFDGYPWFRWGHPLIEMPVLVQGADLVGELFASLLVLAVAGAAVDLVTARGARGGAFAGASVAAAFLAASLGYGAWRLAEAPAGAGPGVLAIQTNLPTSNKVAWAPRDQVRDMPAFAELTLRAAADCGARGLPVALVAWPETMLAGFGLEPETIRMQEANGWFPGNRFQRIASGLAARIGAPLVVGSPAFIGLRDSGGRFVWDRQFNSAYLVGPGDPPYPRYDKVFLAPFGETMPYISNWDWLEHALLSVGAAGMTFDLDRGGEPVRFDVPWEGRAVRVAVPICFEDAMSWVCRDLAFPAAGGRARAADLLVNITNDGWFGWYDAGRAQHLQIARFRCIETRTPMVRSANTGLCAAVDSSGRIASPPPAPRTAAWLHASPPLDARTPPFAAVGEVGSFAIMTLCALIAAIPSFRPRGSAVAALLALGAVSIPACDQSAKTGADQPWSSKSQSIQPTGEARLADTGRTVSTPIPVESSGSAQLSAVTLLKQSLASQVPLYRANGCEALGSSPPDLQQAVAPLFADPNRGVRFVAAMEAGRARLKDLADAVQPLLVDDSASVRAAAIYALTRMGRPVDPSPLAEMLRSDDPEIRSNAYLVLGELGNRSAVAMIRDSLGKGMRQVNPARVRITELQAAEALVRLGEADGIEPIRAALYAPGEQSEFTALAAQQVARLKDEGSRPILMRLIDGTGISARPTEVRIGCALALAQVSPQDQAAVMKFARTLLADRDPAVRSQAVLALGYAGGAAAVPELEPGLFDQNPSVQLAAAKAILVASAPR